MEIDRHLNNALRSLGLAPLGSVDAIVNAYRGSDRHYHNLDHINSCLLLAEDFHHVDPRITLALCYHDVLYDPRSSQNERLSADWACRDLQLVGANISDCDSVVRLIMATTHKTPPILHDERIVVDVDLAILGESPDTYHRYRDAIRQEYAWISDTDFRTGRTQFLNNMLKREFIYATKLMRARFEKQARENIQRELRQIQ